MEWLDEIIDRVNAGGISGEWATQSQVAASSAVDKLELPAIPDDAVVDLVGCLIDEIERLTSERDALLAYLGVETSDATSAPDTGCCDNVTQPQCQACNDTGRMTISVCVTDMLSHVYECVKRPFQEQP